MVRIPVKLALIGLAVAVSCNQSGPNGGWPGTWTALSTMTVRGYDVGTNLDGRLEVQSVGDDGALYTIWQLAPHGAFSAPASTAPSVSAIARVSERPMRPPAPATIKRISAMSEFPRLISLKTLAV